MYKIVVEIMYQYGHLKLLPHVVQRPDVGPGRVRHCGEALPLRRRLHALQRLAKVLHCNVEVVQLCRAQRPLVM